MKHLLSYIKEGRTDYIETAREVYDKLQDMKCPKAGEETYVELSDNRKICIYNDDKSVYKSIRAFLLRDDKPVDHTQEGFWYGDNGVTEEDAWNKLKQRLKKNNINMYDK